MSTEEKKYYLGIMWTTEQKALPGKVTSESERFTGRETEGEHINAEQTHSLSLNIQPKTAL